MNLDFEHSKPKHSAIAAQWDERYSATERVFRMEPDESLVDLVSAINPGSALDLGAGEGRNSLWLASQGWVVTAVDASSVGLSKLEADAKAKGLTVRSEVGEIGEYLNACKQKDQKFDLVILCYIHPGPEEREDLLRGAASVVGDDGHLLVVGHHLDSLGKSGPPQAERLYEDKHMEVVASDLEIITLQRRGGSSDVEDHGTDIVLWAKRKAG